MKTQTNKNAMKIFLKQRKFSKKITQFFTIFLCLISFGISAQNIVFGDAEFKNFLLVSTPSNNFVKDINGNSIKAVSYTHLDVYKRQEEAVKYLAKFSKLMRLTLEFSKESEIPIDKEIEALQNYLELEQLRFKNKFDFKIIKSSETVSYTHLDVYKRQL